MRQPCVLTAIILMLAAGPLCAQRPDREPADARTIQGLEGRLQKAEEARDAALTALRGTYRVLEDHLKNLSAADVDLLNAEVARVLEAPMRAAKEANGTRSSQKRKAQAIFAKELKTIGARLQRAPLDTLGNWVGARVEALLAETGSLDDLLGLTPEDLARRALDPALDTSRPFHERWNDDLAGALPAARNYAEATAAFVKAKNNLTIARDPLLKFTVGAPAGFARIPAGSNYQILNTSGFAGMGNRKWPAKTTRIDQPVDIALYEVTNGEYLEWLDTLDTLGRDEHLPRDAGGRPLWKGDLESGAPKPLKSVLDHPVRGIRLSSAILYAEAKGARLPTEAEWCAMAGAQGKAKEIAQFPWGEAWIPDHCNSAEKELNGPMPVGSFPNGRGPFGHYDVAGNVSEWVMSDFDSGKTLLASELKGLNAVVRGGSYAGGQTEVTVGWVWYRRAAFDRDETTGFRIARDAVVTK